LPIGRKDASGKILSLSNPELRARLASLSQFANRAEKRIRIDSEPIESRTEG
jgi:hypothetical protein